jgi:hypothetical protein
VAKWEQELQGKEEEIISKLERERSNLKSHADDLSAHEAALEMERGRLKKTHEDLCNCLLAISSQEVTLVHHAIALTFTERDLANKEKQLVEKELQELAAMRRTVEELQVAREVEA